MKITCQSCQAKYTIADEKVLGKIVKIRCKKCSSTIVVNGSDSSGQPSYGAAETAPAAAADEGWTVNVADGDQRTMTDAEIVAAFQSGLVGVETFCWKDGMSDWLPLREIDSLYSQCSAGRSPELAPPDDAPRAHGRSAPAPAYAAAAAGNGASNGGPAARRAGGRGQGADLFHGAAQAGGEEEVMTSAPVNAPQPSYEEQKPTGARNENSVLFSLSALTSKGSNAPPPMPGVEASGLIDIRQLSAQMGRGDDKKRSRVDDIMNLSSGGAFNGALAAPTLTAPAADQFGPPTGDAGPAPAKSKGLIFLALGLGTFVIVGAVGATMLLMHKGSDADAAASASASAAATMGAPSASVAAAAGSAEAPTTASAAAPEATATDSTAAAAPTAPAKEAATAAAAPAVTAAPKPAAAAPAHTAAAAPAAVPAAVAAAAQSDQPFNMGEAKSRLGAAAAAVQSCKKGDVTGTGRVTIVFAPGGGAQSATVVGPPFEGTPTGACVAARFKGVHVPAFSGSPFSVAKSFTIN
jgi:predicted Zn finger-like uncharacterized protein